MLRDPNSLKELTAELSAKAPVTGNSFTLASLPPAAQNVGRVVFSPDGATTSGTACAAISNGTDWKVISIGATVGE
jgi:hypothetical protein